MRRDLESTSDTPRCERGGGCEGWLGRGCVRCGGAGGTHGSTSKSDDYTLSSRPARPPLELRSGDAARRRVVVAFAFAVPCRTSPYGEQACCPNIPDGGVLVEFELLRALDSRPRRLHRKSAAGAVAVTALPLRPTLRDVTCRREQLRCARPEFQRHRVHDELAAELRRRSGRPSRGGEDAGKGLENCEEELRRTPALRGYAPMRFTRFVELPAAELRAARARSTAAAARRRVFGRHLPAGRRRLAAARRRR